MPRRLRILPADSVVHALNRGNDKRVLFECSEEYEDFLDMVRRAKAKCTVRIIAYSLMPNHWHFILWPRSDDDVTVFLQYLTTVHAQRWRRQTRSVGCGHVYQDRYRAFPILGESYYFNALRYVEANARRANLVRSASEWPWSSAYERLGNIRGLLDEGPVDLAPDWIRSLDESLPDSVIQEIRKMIRKYRRNCNT